MDVYIENLKKQFNKRILFELRDMEFKSGRINVLMGRNGIGKSTLFNIIAGLDEDYEGSIAYDGEALSKEKMQDITLVSQKPYILNRSVYENLAYPLRLRKYSKREIEEKVEFYIEKLQLKELRDQNGRSLSGGEMQRVSLGRALIFSPKLLLLDEYTASIDERSLGFMEEIVLEYKETGANIIMITHSKEQAERLGDSLVYMKEGL
ncbi:sulfate/thiosulfate import ATP-binding protein CysA [Andreesenia angusta]|uniref:Sulfate/thiosulfate import ATP-binding protein CysA n=1 Tax=Andreesenia angusta TaxID=39480 RepID=A0A1S1V3R4_9FIRM|nr:ATP-binding cassette domain-containing protein [Andreesenia angusta]OHW61346.1 sulfate/thiosulfate import ATP-binding protein CysA [Andreesenia angusta]